jgi:hypothetical protein
MCRKVLQLQCFVTLNSSEGDMAPRRKPHQRVVSEQPMPSVLKRVMSPHSRVA